MVYAAYRSTRRDAVPVEETGSYVPIYASATPVALEIAQEYASEHAPDDDKNVSEAS